MTKPLRDQEYQARVAINGLERWGSSNLEILTLAQARYVRDGLGMLAEHVRTGSRSFGSPMDGLEEIETLRKLLEDGKRQIILLRLPGEVETDD